MKKKDIFMKHPHVWVLLAMAVCFCLVFGAAYLVLGVWMKQTMALEISLTAASFAGIIGYVTVLIRLLKEE